MDRERNKGDRVVRVRQAVIDWFLLFGAAAVLPVKPLGSTGEETTFRAQTASSFSFPFDCSKAGSSLSKYWNHRNESWVSRLSS